MDRKEIETLKELDKSATRGKWDFVQKFGELENYVGSREQADIGKSVCVCQCGQDADYISAANPAAILDLIADYEKLENENAKLRASLSEIADQASRACHDMEHGSEISVGDTVVVKMPENPEKWNSLMLDRIGSASGIVSKINKDGTAKVLFRNEGKRSRKIINYGVRGDIFFTFPINCLEKTGHLNHF